MSLTVVDVHCLYQTNKNEDVCVDVTSHHCYYRRIAEFLFLKIRDNKIDDKTSRTIKKAIWQVDKIFAIFTLASEKS